MSTLYFGLAEEDSGKLHRIFSPNAVPGQLSETQIQLLLQVYPKIYKGECPEIESRLIELWRVIKSLPIPENQVLVTYLLMTFKRKMTINGKFRQEKTYLEFHLAEAEKLPAWERENYLQKNLPWLF